MSNYSINYKNIVVFVLCCFCVVNTLGQPFVDVLNVRYQYFPKVGYKGLDGSVGIRECEVSATLPLVLKNKDVILLGGGYDQLDFEFMPNTHTDRLLCAHAKLGYLHHWRQDTFALLVMAIPKLAADRFRFDASAFQQAGLGMFTYKPKSQLALKLGIYFSPEFFGPFLMPLAGLEWRVLPKVTIYGYLPASACLEYRFSNHLYAGVSYNNLTQSYRLLDSGHYVRNGDRFWGNIHSKVFVNFYFSTYIMAYGELGYTLWRSYDAYDGREKSKTMSGFQPAKNGCVFNLGLAIRVRTDHDSDR